MCLHFSPKPLLKKNHKNPFLFNMTSSKKCKICVRISKTNIVCSCFWEAAMQECFQNKIVLRSSHQDAFFNIAVLQLWWNSLKNTCDGVKFWVNLHVTFSSFEPLLWKLYFITALMLNKNFCRTPLENCLCLEAVVRRCSSK